MSAARSLFLTGCVLLLAVVLAQTAAAGPPASLQISQAVAVGREIGVYLEVRDEAGAAVAGVTAGQLHATVGGHPATVSGLTPFAAAPTGVLYLFLVDRSRSLSAPRFARIRQALTDWVGALGAGDRAALIGFGDRVQVLVEPTADTAALLAAIAELAPTDGHTALHQALARAIDLGRRRAADLPERRVIVTLTDGVDDAPGGISAEEVYAMLAEGPVPIYAVGFSSLRDRARREAGLDALGRFARRSGGVFVDGGRDDPSAAFAAMRTRIAEVYRVQVQCADCPLDGNRYRLQIDLHDAGVTLTAGTDLRLMPEAPAAAPPPGEPVTAAPDPSGSAAPAARPVAPWAWLAGGTGLIGALMVVFLFRRRRGPAASGVLRESPAPELPALDDPAPVPTVPVGTAAGSGGAAPSVSRATVTATFMTGRRRGQQVVLTAAPGVLFGRTPGCDLILADDAEVSAQHAEIEALDNGCLVLRDRGSTNGTRLNGIAIQTTHPLRDGDVIGIGRT
ncbi:VWA domain-containing protein, partial [uncultured Lamprocystis sp.]|uniref:VWA domain-containing protein n=1 Tax=uncultured Lamprocystis sp. TaxID=543132 RepID=UPI0025D65D76